MFFANIGSIQDINIDMSLALPELLISADEILHFILGNVQYGQKALEIRGDIGLKYYFLLHEN